ncbi:uncharacterized protein BDZ99DRAFT_417587 [Mytilinidion resinicola]|uniref:Tcp11-domain-containing protein n=1 Tax=Mytilinidion resinicola TaxID=574789 RepID=A0A6A6YNM3_9PEZI|nr:uncharacterized protein BDZ99DRAFT_417587 [Mytilinidion resinicola]KAF2809575.1 hypothetical protein BDZ99DRAFT_417587 [Mytilinidion resinicola]
MDAPLSDSEAEMVITQTNDDIPEESDIMLSDTENGQIYAPPPRIAARFYRSSNSRRKSSAPSSRRNSISSTHSHQSNRSFRNVCQSNHVAQHLRRASILETRKARLADRAAHAEQVRLRAALAKATPRGSNSEERALAAQQAREKHLAQVAAACAEEVKRAKKVAEDMKERKAAEERRYRLEMEEKLADAERRRAEYKKSTRRPRTASLSPTNESKKAIPGHTLTPEDAAKKIQALWRSRWRRNVVGAFVELGLCIDKVHDATFEDITSILAEEKLLSATSKIMSIFGLLTEGDVAANGTAVRTFLSAYLILGHPEHVFSKDGDQEQDLIRKAKDLVISFESALPRLTAYNNYTPAPIRLETVILAHGAFITAFNDWKARDSSAIIETMVATFVNLDAIWQSVKDETVDEVANEYRMGIRDNQVILLSKIRKLVGPERASLLIRKAIRESRRARPRRRPAGDVRPRLAMESSSPTGSVTSAEVTGLEAEAASQLAESQRTATTDGFQAREITKMFSVMPHNRILVHELAIDKDFRLDPSPQAELREAMHRDLCDSMLKGFENGEGNLWTMAMAENIREKLLRLLKPGNSMHTLISEALDQEHISTQLNQGLFSYEKFFSFTASILPKLCAPVRDAEVKALADELVEEGPLPDMIEKIFKLLHVIDLLSLDYSNFLLMNAAPTLIKESAGYEARSFAQDLDSGKTTLQNTRRWWHNAAVNLHTEADRRDPANRPTTDKIYARGLVDLAIATPPLRDSDLPETLALDRVRLLRIRADAVRITAIGGILLTAKNLLKRDVRSPWKAEAARMWDTLKDGYDATDAALSAKMLSMIESSHAMPPATRAQLASTIARLLTQAQSGKLTDPVMKVLFQRLKTHIFSRISASSSGERVRAASTATEGLATTGLPEFIGQVGEIVETLGRVAGVDRRAHSVWYEQLSEEMERLGQEIEGQGQTGGERSIEA